MYQDSNRSLPGPKAKGLLVNHLASLVNKFKTGKGTPLKRWHWGNCFFNIRRQKKFVKRKKKGLAYKLKFNLNLYQKLWRWNPDKICPQFFRHCNETHGKGGLQLKSNDVLKQKKPGFDFIKVKHHLWHFKCPFLAFKMLLFWHLKCHLFCQLKCQFCQFKLQFLASKASQEIIEVKIC